MGHLKLLKTISFDKVFNVLILKCVIISNQKNPVFSASKVAFFKLLLPSDRKPAMWSPNLPVTEGNSMRCTKFL